MYDYRRNPEDQSERTNLEVQVYTYLPSCVIQNKCLRMTRVRFACPEALPELLDDDTLSASFTKSPSVDDPKGTEPFSALQAAEATQEESDNVEFSFRTVSQSER
ncbi:hypothetical protein DFH11DRAFT_1548351 [Phellopilus nigrolimitatus]|nr:hypothetical protein DFH11DRAFT_1548351 [Phellopilus nigrolimitatus]